MGKALLQGKWVDVTKGDLEKPVVRCRYVAKEFANTKSDDFFSPTPLLGALRLLLSHAASGRSSSTEGRKILVVDAWKAHLCQTKPVCGAPAGGACARNVCTTEAKSLRHSRRTREMGSFSVKAAGEHGICERVGQPMLLLTQQQGSELCCPETASFLLAWNQTWSGRTCRRAFLSRSWVASDVTTPSAQSTSVLEE